MERHVLPGDIERASMSIIQEELDRLNVVLPEEQAAVVKRVIHTTADFDYVENLRFTPGAVELGIAALKRGVPIITDTNMAKAGVSRPALDRLGSEVRCFMADPDVAERARCERATRAAVSMRKAAEHDPGAVLAVGNAPTALLEIAAQMERGLRPALVIAVPVGFVNVTESKERIWAACQRYGVPVIAAMGRKGGSGVAAAICNALLYTAAGGQDGCGSGNSSRSEQRNRSSQGGAFPQPPDGRVPVKAVDEDRATGDASLDNPRNQDGIGASELLVISFGTSFNDSRRLTIGAIEEAMEKAFPAYSVRRGFTSQIIIEHIQRRDGEVIDNVGQALDRAVNNGVKHLIIQPTHLMDGLEYNEVAGKAAQYARAFESITLGSPLLTSDEDFAITAQAMKDATAQYDDGKTAICFMGHGTEAASNAVYAKMQKVMERAGFANCFIGTVEAKPSLEDVLAMVRAGGYARVLLQPMMIVAGDHANNDMASDAESSWKSAFEAAGFQVECVLKGLGEYEAIQQLLVDHVKDAVRQSLRSCIHRR